MNKTLKTLYSLVFTVTGISAIMGVIFVAINKPDYALQEIGCIELSQALVLVVSMLTYFLAFFCKGGKFEKMITLFLAVLMYAFIMREIDFEKLGLPDWVVAITYGKGRAIIVTTGFAVAIIGALMKFNQYKKSTLNFLTTKRAALLVLGGLFLVSGNIVEHGTNWGSFTEVVEEELELLGYCTILCSAILTKKYVDANKK